MISRRQNHRSHIRARIEAESRSLLLQDFLAGRYPNLELSDLVRHVCEFARDRDGSKFIQSKLDEANDNGKYWIFHEMKSNLYALMNDQFANFIVQKFIGIGNAEQCREILRVIEVNFMELCQNKYGCRVVQQAVRITAYQYEILQQFNETNIVQLSQHTHGNHVVQTCFRSVAPFDQDFLCMLIHGHVIDLSYHLHGCRVVQSILMYGTVVAQVSVFKQIKDCLLELIQDRCGNYVIQSAIKFGPSDVKNYLIDYVLKDIRFLSHQKFSSNVVEVGIDFGAPHQQQQAVELIFSLDAQQLKRFCANTFANYVVQKLIDVANMTQLSIFHTKIMPHFNEMERHVCGRNIINRLKERFQLTLLSVQLQNLYIFGDDRMM